MVLSNYVEKFQGVSAKGSPSVLDKFSDKDSLSDWAEESMAWAVEQTLINGNTDGTLQPGGPIQRERAAQIMANALDLGIL